MKRSGDFDPLNMTGRGTFLSPGTRAAALDAALWALGFAGVFVLPWRVPTGPRVYSDSYVLGFNNRAALGCALLALALLTARRLLAPQDPGAPQAALDLPREEWEHALEGSGVPWHRSGSFWAKVVWTAGCCGVLLAWARVVPEARWGEASYVVSRLELMLLGLVPYRDFQFNYGPLFLLGPAAPVWLSGGRIGPGAAHTLALVAFTGAGLAMLSFALRGLLRDAGVRALAFWLVALGAANLSLGLNYTLVRFAFPYAALVLGHRLWLTQPRGARLWAWALLAPALGLAISPEVGIAAWVGVLASCLAWRSLPREHRPSRSPSRSQLLAMPLASLALGVGAIGVASLDYAQAIASFGSGGNNFPLYAAVHTVFFVSVLFATLPRAAELAARRAGASWPLLAAWCAVAVAMLPAAFGRCDPGHIFFNGLGVFLLAFRPLSQASAQRPSRARRAYNLGFATLFSVGMPAVFWLHYKGPITQALEKNSRQHLRPRPRPGALLSAPLDANGMSALQPFKSIGAPLGAEPEMEAWLKASGRLVTEYQLPPLEILTPRQLERKLADLERMPAVVVPAWAMQDGTLDASRAREEHVQTQRLLLSLLFLRPVPYDVRHEPFLPEHEVAAAIASRYVVRARLRGHLLMVRR